MKYTVDYFIKKFEAIPEELWCVNAFHAGNKSCALGHCMDVSNNAAACLSKILNYNVGQINDGEANGYQQPTPKQRILAALHDIKQMQQPELKPERIKTVYVSVPVSITEQIKELIQS